MLRHYAAALRIDGPHSYWIACDSLSHYAHERYADDRLETYLSGATTPVSAENLDNSDFRRSFRRA